MKYIEPEMSIILFNERVGTDDYLVGGSNGGADGDGDLGEGSFITPAYLE